MIICVVSPMYPTKEGKGGYFFVEQLVQIFASMGHHCYVLAPINITSKFFVKKPYGDLYEKQQSKEGGIIEIYRPRYYGRDITIRGVQWASNSSQRSIERLIKTRKLKFDVIYAHFFRSAALIWRYASKMNIPLFVATGESVIPPIDKPCSSFTIEKFRNYLSGVICVSTKNKNEAIKMNFTTQDKCLVLPNGVDLDLFKPANRDECRRCLGIEPSAFLVICVGNIVERKGQNRLVESIERLSNPDVKIVLVGRGVLPVKSQQIIFQGFVDHKELPNYLCASDVYVIPTRWEGCCNSIIEAMACGLPIISSDRSFNWDILNKDNAILVDPDNIDEIGKAIQTLYVDKALREKLGIEAYKTAQGLSIAERAKKIIEFICERQNIS